MINLCACGKKETINTPSAEEVQAALAESAEKLDAEKNTQDIVVINEEAEATEEADEEEPEEVREGFYRSELTNDWIDESIINQRPIAVMIDNEIKALPHYGTSRADVVYEMMNSTLNDRVTRFMCIFKDYNSISQIG